MILTVKSVQEAMKGDSFWLHPDSLEAKTIDQAVSEGYVIRLSHTQVQWKDDESFHKLNNLVKKHKINDVLILYTADEVFDTVEEMFESELAKQKFKMYEHVAKSKSALIKSRFQKGYRLGNEIVYELLLDEGFKILNDLHVHSMLSNTSFKSYTINDSTISIVNTRYANEKANRKQFAIHKINVTQLFHI